MLVVLVLVVLPIGIGDQVAGVSFRGVPYRGLGAGRFEIQRQSLLDQGPADSTPKGLEKNVYSFPDIAPDRALVAFVPDGTPMLFIPERLFLSLPAPSAGGGDGLAVAIPELCGYWRPPVPLECRGPTESQR